jgi:hypothetical protein
MFKTTHSSVSSLDDVTSHDHHDDFADPLQVTKQTIKDVHHYYTYTFGLTACGSDVGAHRSSPPNSWIRFCQSAGSLQSSVKRRLDWSMADHPVRTPAHEEH